MNPRDLFVTWSNLPVSANLVGWRFVCHHEGAEPALVAALRGTEIHVAADPRFRGVLMTRQKVRAFLDPLLQESGYLTTRVMHGTSDEFVRRIGFKKTWDDMECSHYMLSGIPLSEKVN